MKHKAVIYCSNQVLQLRHSKVSTPLVGTIQTVEIPVSHCSYGKEELNDDITTHIDCSFLGHSPG